MRYHADNLSDGYAAILLLLSMICAGCSAKTEESPSNITSAHNWDDMAPVGSMDLLYADQLPVEDYGDDITLITIGESDRFLLLPENMSAPDGLRIPSRSCKSR